MHKKATITKDETLTVAARSNGMEKKAYSFAPSDESDQAKQEEVFLSAVLSGYTYWLKQPGDLAKSYAAAYRTLLNEFTAEETEK